MQQWFDVDCLQVPESGERNEIFQTKAPLKSEVTDPCNDAHGHPKTSRTFAQI